MTELDKCVEGMRIAMDKYIGIHPAGDIASSEFTGRAILRGAFNVLQDRATKEAETLANLRRFCNEEVCPVNEQLLAGFVAGAYDGWGRARNRVSQILGDS